MTRGRVVLAVAVAAIGVTAYAAYVVLAPQRTLYDHLSDEQYVAIAASLPEAQIFLSAYPRAEASVDRSGALAVDFRPGESPEPHAVGLTSGERLRVFLDPASNRPRGALFQCGEKVVEAEVMSYLRQYVETRACR